MGCRHRRVKKAVAAIKSARQSGNGAAVRRAVDTAKRLTGTGAALRDSERELRRLVGQAGPSRRAAPRASSSAPARAEDAKAAAWEESSD